MTHQICSVCQRPLVHKLVKYTLWFNERLIVVENVPAWVCEQCGETYYDPDVVDQLTQLIWSDTAPVRMVETPIYDLAKKIS